MSPMLDLGRISRALKPVTFFLLTLGILVMGGTLVLVVNNIRQEIEDTQADFRSDVPWWASQIDYELLTLISTLSQRHYSPERVSHDELVQSFDIFWSRIENTSNGSLGSAVLELTGAETAMTAAQATLKRLEPLVLAFEPGDSESFTILQDELRATSEAIHPLTMAALSFKHRELGAHGQRLRAVLWQVVAMFIGVLLCGAMLVAMIVAEKSKVQKLSQELESRVDRRTRELQRSNEELEQFAYVASHDLQEPLRKISGFCGILEAQLKGRLDREEEEYFGYLADAAKRMQQLIRDLLALSRVGSRDLKLEPVDCNDLLDRVLRDIDLAIEENGARIVYQGLPRILGDSDQLGLLFGNLIGNSVKYRAAEPPEVVISARQVDDQVRFSVSDNGIGFEAKFAERIFRTFQRLHPRGDYEGTGIGLAICKKVVERHGGQIWAEAEPDKGSTFWFSVPAG